MKRQRILRRTKKCKEIKRQRIYDEEEEQEEKEANEEKGEENQDVHKIQISEE